MSRTYEVRFCVIDCDACRRQIVTADAAGDAADAEREVEVAKAFARHRFPDALVLASDAEGHVHCPCGNPAAGEAARDASREMLRAFPPHHTPELR